MMGGIGGRRRRGRQEDEMVGWHHWLDAHEFGWTPGAGNGQGGLVCCDSWGHKESDTTEQLRWAELNWTGGGNCNLLLATHSSVLAWRIPGTGEPGGLPSMGSHRVRHDWSDLAAVAARIFSWRIPWTEELVKLQSRGSQRVRHDWVTNTHLLIAQCFTLSSIFCGTAH